MNLGKELFELGLSMTRARRDVILEEAGLSNPIAVEFPETVWRPNRRVEVLCCVPLPQKACVCFDSEDSALNFSSSAEEQDFDDVIQVASEHGFDWVILADCNAHEVARYPTR